MLNSSFAGKHFPPGSLVAFNFKGDYMEGEVIQLLKYQARVATDQGLFKVGYANLEIIESIQPEPEMPLEIIEAFVADMFEEHGLDEAGWQFGFDLTKRRGGVCNYTYKRITLSVSYCLNASMDEVINTVLHETAHALVGSGNGHNHIWRAKAIEIGCSGERCHTVSHTQSKYIGECGCGNTWKRDRLTARLQNAYCPKCNGDIQWRVRHLNDK